MPTTCYKHGADTFGLIWATFGIYSRVTALISVMWDRCAPDVTNHLCNGIPVGVLRASKVGHELKEKKVSDLG